MQGPPLLDGRFPMPPNRAFKKALSGAPVRYGSLRGVNSPRTSDPYVRMFYGPSLSAWYNPLTWLDPDSKALLDKAASTVQDALSLIAGQDKRLQAYFAQVRPFESSSNPNVKEKALFIDSKITGLLDVYSAVNSDAASLSSQIKSMPQSDLAGAQGLKNQADALKARADEFFDDLKAVKTDVEHLIDPGVLQKIESGLSNLGVGVVGTFQKSTMIIAGVVGLGILAFMVSPKFRRALIHV